MKKGISILCITILTSCSTSLTDKGKKVRVVESKEAVSTMEFISNVEGSSSLSGLWRHTGYNNALNECINEAGDLGASHIFIPKGRGGYWRWSQKVKGEAYK